jgi:hypothetical protein
MLLPRRLGLEASITKTVFLGNRCSRRSGFRSRLRTWFPAIASLRSVKRRLLQFNRQPKPGVNRKLQPSSLLLWSNFMRSNHTFTLGLWLLYSQADIRAMKLHCKLEGIQDCVLTASPDLDWRKHGLYCMSAKLFSPDEDWSEVLTQGEFQSSLQIARSASNQRE